MNAKKELQKIKDLADFVTNNQPYFIDIDIHKGDDPESDESHNYWEVGMKTKYKGVDVEILDCPKTVDYSKIIAENNDGIATKEKRAICTLLIRNVQ